MSHRIIRIPDGVKVILQHDLLRRIGKRTVVSQRQ
jgi:hypothetical protein